MKKIVLVDGNNLLFRSYYATAYTGNIMRNKEGFPTNGVYGFVNMINKIISDEKPEYMMVAFDIGKTFRHEKYERYKDGRRETPDDLKVQFPVAKKILTAMGIKYLECAGYEADDIIGTISMWCEKDPEYDALIVSSDKDLLQLISDETVVKLLKTKDYIWMDKKTFNDTYGFDPIHMIDLKALMGDSSDNIPGVKGIGEKGAIKLVSEYKTIDNIYLFESIEMPLTKVLANMEIEGIRVDKKVLEEMGIEIKIKLEILTRDIYNYAGEEFNINSPKQLGEILFDKLKLPGAKKNKNGYATDIDVLKKLTEYPIINKILEYRALAKLYSTYIDGIISTIREDGKIHTIYTQTLTRTGRLSSIEPNLQNIPMRSEYGRLIRKAFIPEDNSVILSSDYSQIELRVFAHLSGVNDLINAFKEGVDIHTKTAMDIFKVPMEGVTKNMRRQAKAVNFGILYGISSYGLAEDIGIPVKEAKEFINKYFETYPGVKDYMDKEIDEAKRNGYVKTIMNRKRVIEELKSSNYMVRSMGERMALNTPVQGSASDILKKAMVEINNIFEKENIKSKMLLQVHDELIFNVYNDEIDKVKDIVYNTMTKVFELKVPLDVDIELGNNWYEAK